MWHSDGVAGGAVDMLRWLWDHAFPLWRHLVWINIVTSHNVWFPYEYSLAKWNCYGQFITLILTNSKQWYVCDNLWDPANPAHPPGLVLNYLLSYGPLWAQLQMRISRGSLTNKSDLIILWYTQFYSKIQSSTLTLKSDNFDFKFYEIYLTWSVERFMEQNESTLHNSLLLIIQQCTHLWKHRELMN